MAKAHAGFMPGSGKTFDDGFSAIAAFNTSKNGRLATSAKIGAMEYDIGTGFHAKRKPGWKKSVTPKKRTITGLDGKKHTVSYYEGFDDEIHFGHSSDTSATFEDRIAYAEKAFGDNLSDSDVKPSVVKTKGCGHIYYLEYNYEMQVLRVTFISGDICVFFRVPSAVAGELIHHAKTQQAILDKSNHDRHLLGIRFWDLVRIRGNLRGARYPFEYQHSNYRPKTTSYYNRHPIIINDENSRKVVAGALAGLGPDKLALMEKQGLFKPGSKFTIVLNDDEYRKFLNEVMNQLNDSQNININTKKKVSKKDSKDDDIEIDNSTMLDRIAADDAYNPEVYDMSMRDKYSEHTAMADSARRRFIEDTLVSKINAKLEQAKNTKEYETTRADYLDKHSVEGLREKLSNEMLPESERIVSKEARAAAEKQYAKLSNKLEDDSLSDKKKREIEHELYKIERGLSGKKYSPEEVDSIVAGKLEKYETRADLNAMIAGIRAALPETESENLLKALDLRNGQIKVGFDRQSMNRLAMAAADSTNAYGAPAISMNGVDISVRNLHRNFNKLVSNAANPVYMASRIWTINDLKAVASGEINFEGMTTEHAAMFKKYMANNDYQGAFNVLQNYSRPLKINNRLYKNVHYIENWDTLELNGGE